MMAALAASHAHRASVLLLEKNEKPGKKLYITGKGRCNLTNNTDVEGLMNHVVRNPRFLFSAFHALDAPALMAYIEKIGVPLKTERGNRVFPQSDKAGDITRALEAQLKKSGVQLKLRTTVTGISPDLQINTSREIIKPDAIILATGGLSYPATGSTGDGFSFARRLGHTVADTFPSLVPLHSDAPWLPELTGLSLRNVRLTARLPNGKVLYEETGELLFTPEGISGPLVLRASAYITDMPDALPTLWLDMKPALDAPRLDARLLRDFAESPNKSFGNLLPALVPARMANAIAALCRIPVTTKANTLTKMQRATLVQVLKSIPLSITHTAGYNEAVITRGGITTREINPATLMSKKIPGLFFAGECIDTDALTGGYNLQIAFATGHLAGISAANYIQ